MYLRSNESNGDFNNDFASGPFAPYGNLAAHIVEHFNRYYYLMSVYLSVFSFVCFSFLFLFIFFNFEKYL